MDARACSACPPTPTVNDRSGCTAGRSTSGRQGTEHLPTHTHRQRRVHSWACQGKRCMPPHTHRQRQERVHSLGRQGMQCMPPHTHRQRQERVHSWDGGTLGRQGMQCMGKCGGGRHKRRQGDCPSVIIGAVEVGVGVLPAQRRGGA